MIKVDELTYSPASGPGILAAGCCDLTIYLYNARHEYQFIAKWVAQRLRWGVSMAWVSALHFYSWLAAAGHALFLLYSFACQQPAVLLLLCMLVCTL